MGLQKNLYWMSSVRPNMTPPWMAMANRFLPTMFQLRGFSKRSSPEETNTHQLSSQISGSFPECEHLTQVLVESGHRLVFGHVHQPSSQTEMREHQQSLFDYVIDTGYILERNTDGTEKGNVRLETLGSSEWCISMHAASLIVISCISIHLFLCAFWIIT